LEKSGQLRFHEKKSYKKSIPFDEKLDKKFRQKYIKIRFFTEKNSSTRFTDSDRDSRLDRINVVE